MFARLTTHSLIIILTGLFAAPVCAESLEMVVFKTLASHPEIKAEINRKIAREQELKQAESGHYPTVDLQAAIGYENSKNRYTESLGESDFVDQTRTEQAFIVTYNLFKGYETTGNVNLYSARVRTAGHQLHELTEQTALEVARVYLRVLRSRRLVELSEQTLAVYMNLFDKVKSRSQSGVGKKSDISQAQGRVARAHANLVNDRAELQNAEASFLRLTGQRPLDLSQPLDVSPGLPANLQLAIDAAMRSNPLIRAALAEIDAANAQKRVASSGNYPKLDLVFEQSRGENLDGLDDVEEDYSLMLRMHYNLFKGGFDAARSEQAEAEFGESMEELDDLRRRVSESVRLAWNSYEAVKMQIPYLQQHVESISRTRIAYADQFRIGQRSLLDLLDSENELYQARRALVAAGYDQLVGAYRILADMGKFVDELETVNQ